MKARICSTVGVLLAGVMVGMGNPDEKEKPGEGGKKKGKAKWTSLVPEKEMGHWKAINFGGEGESAWEKGVLTINEGAELSGVVWGGELPEAPYEIELEARRTSGVDFFCGLTFPVRDKKTCVTLIVGGWGGGVVGISSIDDMDASENETTSYQAFKDEQWYKIRVEVRKDRLKAWVDKKELVDVDTKGRKLGLRFGDIERCVPLGLATYQTTSEVRNFRWRKLEK